MRAMHHTSLPWPSNLLHPPANNPGNWPAPLDCLPKSYRTEKPGPKSVWDCRHILRGSMNGPASSPIVNKEAYHFDWNPHGSSLSRKKMGLSAEEAVRSMATNWETGRLLRCCLPETSLILWKITTARISFASTCPASAITRESMSSRIQ